MLPVKPWYCRTILAWALAVACVAAQAQGVFVVTEPWVRPAAARQSTEAYVRLMSSTGATLVAVQSELAAGVVLRSPTGKPVAPMVLPLPAAEIVSLQPKGYRLVLQQLSRGLKTGDRVPIVLTVRNTDGTVQAIAVDAEVRLHSPTDDHRVPHTHP
jgi:periplasmic copper chaperone A